jgi:hypothetical protein
VFSLSSTQASVIGQTYPIAEPDALKEIQRQAGKINWSDKFKNGKKSALASIHLPPATSTKRRTFVPLYRAPFDVIDPKSGKMLYPKGYQYNVLEFVKMPFRVVVFRKENTDWVKKNALKTDVLILADSGLFDVQSELNRAVYVLDKKMQQRLSLKFAPSIVTQEKSHFIINEIEVKNDDTP